MGHSEDYIRNKMYELEKEKVEIERMKIKVLMDIRDAIMVVDTIAVGKIAFEAKTDREINIYNACKQAMDSVIETTKKRWSE